MVGNDFNELSTLSQGRWRGIYTPPQNLTVDALIAAVVPEVHAVLPENSGTTGPGTRPPSFKLHQVLPRAVVLLTLPESGSTA
jgi:hypothetical protein